MIESRESLMRRCSVADAMVELKQGARDEIARQVDEFLARCGVIQKAGDGDSAGFNPGVVYRNYPALDELNSNDHGLPYASTFIGMSERALQRLIRAGKGPAHTAVQRGDCTIYRFRMADLTAFREGRK